MQKRRSFLTLSAAALLAGCARPSGPDTSRLYAGPEITRVEVLKGQRKLRLIAQNTIVKSYEIDLGFAPTGTKRFEGDGKTPEGRYFIDRRNHNSSFYLSLGISYPNRRDVQVARAAGRKPGGDIFIHGERRKRFGKRSGPDWTAGCIALKNNEMREIFWMVRVGTPIAIYA